jgi:NAD(P)-dependent dehydrogenase (short-subunit alcohol dehydrogenase family)
MKKLIRFNSLSKFTLGVIFFTLSIINSASSNNMKPMEQRAILVTGASSGIGNNIAKTLAKNGYFVYAGARKEKDINDLSRIPNIQGIKLDVNIQSEIDAAVDTIQKGKRGLYGLVNNAGVALFAPLIEISEADLQFQMNVNVFGPFRVTKAFAPLIIKSKGRITTIGSVAGLVSGSMFGPYSMSKFSMEAYTEALAQEMKKFEVQVSIIEPGNYNSKIMSNLKKREKKNSNSIKNSLYTQEYKQLEKFTNANRSHFKEPDEVASAVIKALFDEKASLRYLVVPTRKGAIFPIKNILAKAVHINEQQEYKFKRSQLIEWLDEALKDNE